VRSCSAYIPDFTARSIIILSLPVQTARPAREAVAVVAAVVVVAAAVAVAVAAEAAELIENASYIHEKAYKIKKAAYAAFYHISDHRLFKSISCGLNEYRCSCIQSPADVNPMLTVRRHRLNLLTILRLFLPVDQYQTLYC
jgi:hypothetical protein